MRDQPVGEFRRADRVPPAGPDRSRIDATVEERSVDLVVVPIDEVGGGVRREAAQRLDRILRVGRGHRRLQLRVEECASTSDHQLEEAAEQA